MDEVISDVYDIGQPTPVSLQKLSAIAVSLEIWRREVNEYRKSNTLESFKPLSSRILLKVTLPELPSVIYNIIDKYVRRFGFSVSTWVSDHYDWRICRSDYSGRMNVLRDFDDFVCDYDGSIHYVRTAERMMRCDKLVDVMKFNIACRYFFEDDIKRMWPFVSKKIDIDSIDFYEYPQMYYWICRLTNKLHKITLSWVNVTIDEEMFERRLPRNMPSLEYFWNRVSREKQVRKALSVCIVDVKTFIRIILPKLDNRQLNEVVNWCNWYSILRTNESIDEDLVLRTWLYIGNFMNENNFIGLVANMLRTRYRKDDCKDNAEDHVEYNADVVRRNNRYMYLCCEIWNNSPPNLKSSVIRDLLPGTMFLEKIGTTGDFNSMLINAELLLLILRYASFEERYSFWHNCWRHLIAAVRGEDLQRIMKLCYETREHEMAEFKDLMARSEDVRRLCVQLLREGEYFDHLNELVSFIRPEMHNSRGFKQQILRECLILHPHHRLETWIVHCAEKLNDFIYSAFDDVDLSTEFKNRLMPSSSVIRNSLWSLIRKQEVPVKQLIEFVDTFVPTDEIVVQIKMSIADSIKQCVTATARRRRPNQDMIGKPYFTSILLWCLGSDEEVDKFKHICAL